MLHTHIVLQKRIHVSALLSASLLLVLSSLAFFPIASSYSSTLAAPAPSETTLSMTAESINLNLSVDNANGTFNASDPANLTVATNNYTGYTLSLLASSNDADATKLVNGENSISSISSVSSADDFNVGNWGIKPSKVNSAANNSYIPAPTSEGTTLDATNSANAEANSYTIALGAKADYSLPAGRYSNTFVITAVANPVGFSISYNKNTTSGVGNMPSTQTGSLEDADVTISTKVPTRTGYLFNNWCDGTVTTENNLDSCDGVVYEPGDVFYTSKLTSNSLSLKAMWNRSYTLYFNANQGTGTMDPQVITGTSANINENTFTREGYIFTGWNTSSSGSGTKYASGAVFTVPESGSSRTLYAQWKEIITFEKAFAGMGFEKRMVDGVGYYAMQDMNPSLCSYIDKGQETQLVDVRDNSIYTIGRLLDGQCWLLDNLALDLTDETVKATLDESNTNASNTTINYLKNGGGSSSDQYAMTGIALQESASNQQKSYSEPRVWYNLEQKDIVPIDYNGANDPMKEEVEAGNWKVGLYYNYCAASAGSYCYGEGTEPGNPVDVPSTKRDVDEDICPAGWRMGTIDLISSYSSEDYDQLFKYYEAFQNASNYLLLRRAFHLPLSGSVTDGWIRSRYYGTDALVWTSTTMNNSANKKHMETLRTYISGSNGYVDSIAIERYSMASVRCVAKKNNEPGSINEAFSAAGKSTTYKSWSNVLGNYGGSLYQMQDMDSSICSAIRIGAEGRLYDNRDGRVYTIVKAKDGKCWMTQNLDHNIVAQEGYYTPENTDITEAWTPSRAYTSSISSSTGVISNWENSNSTPYSFDAYARYWTGEWYDSEECSSTQENDWAGCNYKMNNGAKGKFNSSTYLYNLEHGHVGNYYNWSAAIASNDTSGINTDGTNANTSICPKGWRLPSASDVNDFAVLMDSYDARNTADGYKDKKAATYPLYFVRGGEVWDAGLHSAGANGLYWSSTVKSSDEAYGLDLSSDAINVASEANRYNGRSIRCVAR